MSIHLSAIKSVPIERVAEVLGMDVRRHKALCPFHDDHHPSLHFHARSNTFCCFACGSKGSNIDLVMRTDGSTFADACRRIAEIGGIYDYSRNLAAGRIVASARQRADCTPLRAALPHACAEPDVIDPMLVRRFESTGSCFCRALVDSGILTAGQMSRAAARYRLGCSAAGGVVFWQIDCRQRVLDGKIMWYGNDCHRDKGRSPVSASWLLKRKGLLPLSWQRSRCLFGLHLLTNTGMPSCTDIAIVESEKTAVICSELLPSTGGTDCLWMATGGLSCLSADMLRPLAGHRVTIFPDTDVGGDTFRLWSEIADKAGKQLGQTFHVSDILERNASEKQKQSKIDIADFLNVEC